MKLGLLLVVFSITTFTHAASGIIKEAWTCKNEAGKTLRAELTSKTQKISVNGSKVAFQPREDFGNNLIEKALLSEFKATEEIGYDSTDYLVTLVRMNEDDEFSSEGDRVSKARGQAVVVKNGFIDCIGYRAESFALTCDVTVERKR